MKEKAKKKRYSRCQADFLSKKTLCFLLEKIEKIKVEKKKKIVSKLVNKKVKQNKRTKYKSSLSPIFYTPLK